MAGTPYDVIIVGSGAAAQATSTRVHDAGWSVAIVDQAPLGGTCALRGCNPKKVLVACAAAADIGGRRGRGIDGDLRINWRDLMRFKRSFTDPVPAQQKAYYEKAGIDAIQGQARFLDRRTIDVDGRVLTGKYVVLATGARPAGLGCPGEEHLVTSDRFLELETLPARIVFVGGGYIATELSHVAARAGARATILHQQARLLPQFDPDLVDWLADKFHDLGIDVRTNSTVTRIEPSGGGVRVHARAGTVDFTVDADMAVHAAGRVPDLDRLGLAEAGVAVANGRLVLNEFLQSTSNPAVYAAGDATAMGPPLTPVAAYDGRIVAANLLQGNHQRPDYRGTPSVAFTIPPIATVGMSEAACRDRGLNIRVKSGRVPEWYTARAAVETVYGYKTVVDEETNRVLGAHLVGPHADETINLFAVAIRHGLTADELRGTLFSYPTGASDLSYML